MVKIGGSVAAASDGLLDNIAFLHTEIGIPLVIIHGGGSEIDAALKEQGVEKFCLQWQISFQQEHMLIKQLKIFKKYQVNQKLMKEAKKDAIFLHCLPAYRGNEVAADIIDASASSLDRARELFREDENVVVHPARYLQSDEVVLQGVPKPPQLVTAIGGICGGVISRQEALGVTQRIYEEMAEGGTFVATGKTGVRLNAKDFSRIGFKVTQMTIPENVVYLRSPYQLYVLEK